VKLAQLLAEKYAHNNALHALNVNICPPEKGIVLGLYCLLYCAKVIIYEKGVSLFDNGKVF